MDKLGINLSERTSTAIKTFAVTSCVLCVAIFAGCSFKASMEPTTTEPKTTAAESTAGQINATTKQKDIASEQPQVQEDGSIITGEKASGTLSGYASLPAIDYTAGDPQNSRGLSTSKIGHSHGPASGGKAHYTVVNFQKKFDEYGALAVDTVSTDKVLYLTFDCGWEHDNLTSRVLDILKEKDVPAAFFCTLTHIKQQPELIARMIKEGHIVGNHSATHPSFAEIDREQMADEIEKTENHMRENFGYAAKYFRFPSGEYNESALELVSSLGYMCAFWSVAYDDWDVTNIRGADYAVDTVMKRLHPGAVVLLHSVSVDNADALGRIIDEARAQGYTFLSLQDYAK